jgi:hypothetical protein
MTLNDKVLQLWSRVLRQAKFWIIAILSPRTSPVSYDLHDCTSHLLAVCNLSVTAWVLIKVKVSLTIHEDSDTGWNVWHSALL